MTAISKVAGRRKPQPVRLRRWLLFKPDEGLNPDAEPRAEGGRGEDLSKRDTEHYLPKLEH